MPTTNRPFFANFFAAFRAHSALQKSPPAIHGASYSSASNSIAANPTSAAAAAYTTLSKSYHTSPQPDSQSIPIPPKHNLPVPQPTYTATSQNATSVATVPTQSHFRSSRPLHPPNGTPQSRGRMRSHSREAVYGQQPQSHPPEAITPPFPSRTPSPGSSTTSPTSPNSLPSYGFPRGRRGSDSSASSSGSPTSASNTSKAMAEKWYIGGRTAGGEERFYKLGLVRSSGSADRLSLDRLSL